MITKGNKGAEIYFENEIISIEPIKLELLNTIGAGDIFASVFSLEYYKSKNIFLSGKIANNVAAKSIEYLGLESINSDVFKIFQK